MNCVYRHAKTALLSVFLSVFLMMGAAVPENLVPESFLPEGLVPEGFLPVDCRYCSCFLAPFSPKFI